MTKKKQIFTETPKTTGPMKPNEKIQSPDKPIFSPQPSPIEKK